MNLFTILTYLNKLSLVAFFITAVVLIYQVVIIRRNHKKKNSTPIVPNFNENMIIPVKNFTSINEEKIIHKTNPMPKTILYPIIAITLICLIIVVYLINKKNQTVNMSNNVNVSNLITPTSIIERNVTPSINIPTSTPVPIQIPTIENTPQIIPTRIPTAANNEVVIAHIEPSVIPEVSSSLSPSIASPVITGQEKTLPLTGTIENSLIIAAVSGFMIVLAFVF